MDFLDMNFSTLFEKEHGKEIFDSICMLIKEENSNNINDLYISEIFKIAFLDFWGLKEYEIENLLKDLQLSKSINVKKIKCIHNQSISKIKMYLKTFL